MIEMFKGHIFNYKHLYMRAIIIFNIILQERCLATLSQFHGALRTTLSDVHTLHTHITHTPIA